MSDTSPIFLTGTPRSGTSMTAGIISACGAFGGCGGGAVRRKKNPYENPAVRNLMSECFRDMGVDVRGQFPLPKAGDLLNCRMGFGEAVKYHIKESGYIDGPWFYKDARLCLVWSFWTNAFPNAKWVVVRRRDECIVNSCMRTGYMDAFQDWGGWRWWVNQYKSRFKDIRMACPGRVKEVWPGKYLDGDFSEVMKVVDWLGLEWKERQVRCTLTPTKADRGRTLGVPLKRA